MYAHIIRPAVFFITILSFWSVRTAQAGPQLTVAGDFNFFVGQGSNAGLTFNSSGDAYGTSLSYGSFQGNSNNTFGTLFVDHNNSLTVLGGFSNSTALNAHGNVLLDGSGNIYGVTQNGGPGQYGALWKYSAAQPFLGIQVLTVFNNTNGATPYGDLIFDRTRQFLLGTTTNGGANFDGTVFKYSLATGKLTTFVNFGDSTGIRPQGGLVQDASGNLYGTTWLSGPGGFGTVFEIPAATGSLKTLATFDNGNLAGGANPSAALAIDSAGNLFGTTQAGGANLDGTIFEVPAGTQNVITLGSFNGTNGRSPSGPLLLDAAGNLFGVTATGGPFDRGVAFELPHGSNTILELANFYGVTGYSPYPSLSADANGNLFGTANIQFFELTGSGFVTPLPSSFAYLTICCVMLLLVRQIWLRLHCTSW